MEPIENRNPINIALRAYTERLDQPHRAGSPRPWKGWQEQILVFDTETTVDELQRLTFGSYRHYQYNESGEMEFVEEGIFYEDELPVTDAAGWAVLSCYAETERSHAQKSEIMLLSKSDFLSRVFFPLAYEKQALVVGFNLPFDLMRLAAAWGDGRGKFLGGFSAVLWQARNEETGEMVENRWRPRLLLKLMDSKRAFIEFAKPVGIDSRHKEELTDESGRRVFGAFRGHFLDLRTLAFALTSESLSLESACNRFKVEHPKEKALKHGEITKQYIDYNRRDVLATSELLNALADEFDRHPIGLDPCKAYSPASIAKAYMRAMGVRPPFEKFADLPTELNGIAMAAYYGGRAECHIRKIGVPVVHTDFISMYPTVNSLMGLWEIIVAKRLRMEDYTDHARRLLDNATLDGWFDPTLWGDLKWFGEVELDDDIVPIRGQYDPASDALNIAVSRVTSNAPLWFTGPDLVASALLRQKPPRLKRAVVLLPDGQQDDLCPVRFGGEVDIDPASQDFFRRIVEIRKGSKPNDTLSAIERDRVSQSLKIMASSGSYGIFAEINREQIPKAEVVPVRVHGLGSSFDVSTSAPESPGEFCFPPLAALITGGARLMLALLERSVTDEGGTYAFCDTDSMAIVATDRFDCTGDLPKGTPEYRAIPKLDSTDVDEIVARFKRLNPYDPDILPGSVLEVTRVNYSELGDFGDLWVYAIAAKRYAFHRWAPYGVDIVDASEHGLGHLMNPRSADPFANWIDDAWQWILSDALRFLLPELPFLDRPAISRISISSPHVLKPFADAQSELPFSERIRPTNFLLSATLQATGEPVGTDRTRFHLLRPYTKDSTAWLEDKWTDVHSGHQYTVTTQWPAAPYDASIKSYRDVLGSYASHPEAKSAGKDGEPCTRITEGHLQRRKISIAEILFVGKETNRLEDVQNGLVHDWNEVSAIYRNPDLDTWKTEVVPELKKIPCAELAEAAEISERAVRSIRNGHSKPTAETKAALLKAVEARAKPARKRAKKGPARGETKKAKKRN